MTRRRAIVLLLVLLLLAAATTGVWVAEDWPPPLLLLRYGRLPVGGRTGRERTVGGIRFVELSAGYYRMGTHAHCEKGDLPGRICAALGLPWGTHPRHDGHECPPRWVVIPAPIWVARSEVMNEAFERFAPGRQRIPRDAAADEPVMGVSFEQADAYCRWLLERGDGLVRLVASNLGDRPLDVPLLPVGAGLPGGPLKMPPGGETGGWHPLGRWNGFSWARRFTDRPGRSLRGSTR